jgi:hypothetical protein
MAFGLIRPYGSDDRQRPKATHHRALGGTRSAMTWLRGCPSTVAGSHSFNRIVSMRVASNGPATVAKTQLMQEITSAHGHASNSD